MQDRRNETQVIVWFRRDLRIRDHKALTAAAASGRPVLPVFLFEECVAPLGGAGKWWLHHSLVALRESLAELGLPLVLLRGTARETLVEWLSKVGAQEIHWHRRYEPDAAARDERTAKALRARGLEVHEHAGALLAEPNSLANKQGGPYQVFTPYSKAFAERILPDPVLEIPSAVQAAPLPNDSLAIEELGLLPAVDWAAGLRATWRPGPGDAAQKLKQFLDGPLERYRAERDRPDLEGTSQLSPHLHWGEISPREIWQAAQATGDEIGEPVGPFLRQLIWREFAHHLLHHYPHTIDRPLRPAFENFPWDGDPDLLGAWQRGRTGYPLVDAGMRQLWSTGWMHNRVRMVVASFLVKHLLLPWQYGAAWFADTLVDADLANNTFGWQWTAGCGADAAPYFRVFNPMIQGKKFDPEGHYVRRWVPELRGLPKRWIHEPWLAPPQELASASISLGGDYPQPIVAHAAARERALESYRRMKGN